MASPLISTDNFDGLLWLLLLEGLPNSLILYHVNPATLEVRRLPKLHFPVYQPLTQPQYCLCQSRLMHFLFSKTIILFRALAITYLSSWNFIIDSLYMLVCPLVSVRVSITLVSLCMISLLRWWSAFSVCMFAWL